MPCRWMPCGPCWMFVFTLVLMLLGYIGLALFILPVILMYTFCSYCVFYGK